MTEIERMEYLINKGYTADEFGRIKSHMGTIIKRTSKYKSGRRYLIVQFYIKGERKRVRGHRFIFYYFNRFLPTMVDHINGETLDNRINNLRAATASINNQNRRGVKGYYLTRAGNYSVVIWANKVRKNCGTYTSEMVARSVYLYWKSILHI
jgi:hypothetical protein